MLPFAGHLGELRTSRQLGLGKLCTWYVYTGEVSHGRTYLDSMGSGKGVSISILVGLSNTRTI